MNQKIRPQDTFGFLTVIKKAYRDKLLGRTYYTCKCSCGIFTEVSSRTLLHGTDQKCSTCADRDVRLKEACKEGIEKAIRIKAQVFKNSTLTLREIAELYGLNHKTLRSRINLLKWDNERALIEPVKKKACKPRPPEA
jgi:hypothetical protein